MFRTTFEKNIESATSHLLLEPDWTTILLICDDINQKDVSPKIAFNAIKKKISSPNPHSAYYALLVLESVVKNCGTPMHEEVFTRENCEMFSNLLEQTTHENVRQKILELVQTWAYAFRSTEKYQAVKDTMTILKANGHTFPELVEADAMFKADTAPNWADGNVCHRCRTTFSVMNRKHHCRNCGQVFCGLCSRKQCPLPKFGIEKEVRICDGCFIALQRPPTAKSSARSAETDLPAEYLNSSLAQQVQTPSRKTDQELEEEEELQLALALSQSEAEQKKQQQLKQQQQQLQSSAAPYRIQQRSPSPEAPPAPKELLQQEPENPELAKYLNRNFWEQRKISDSPMNSPSAPSPMPTPQPQTTLHDKPTDEVQIDEFAAHMRSQVEIFVNRMKSNSSRGRSIANDSSVQTLFMNLTSLHSDQLSYIKEMDDKRMWYEQLQDKLVQIKDSRAALDVLRQEHVEKLRQMAEEQERQRQNQMAQKLEIMRKKKQEYLQYQRQLALQRIQEQEREMQMRQEQQKAQYRMGQAGFPYMAPAGVAPPYNPYAYIANSAGRMPSAPFNSQGGQQVANALPPGMYAAPGMGSAAPNQNQHQTMLMHGQINPNAVMPPSAPNGGQMLNSSVIQQPGLPQMGDNTMQQNPAPGLNVGPPQQQQQQQQQQQLHALHQMPQVMHLPQQNVVHGQPPPQMAPQVGTAAVAPLANQQIQAVAAAPAPPQQDPEPPAAAAAVGKPEPATAELISFD